MPPKRSSSAAFETEPPLKRAREQQTFSDEDADATVKDERAQQAACNGDERAVIPGVNDEHAAVVEEKQNTEVVVQKAGPKLTESALRRVLLWLEETFNDKMARIYVLTRYYGHRPDKYCRTNILFSADDAIALIKARAPETPPYMEGLIKGHTRDNYSGRYWNLIIRGYSYAELMRYFGPRVCEHENAAYRLSQNLARWAWIPFPVVFEFLYGDHDALVSSGPGILQTTWLRPNTHLRNNSVAELLAETRDEAAHRLDGAWRLLEVPGTPTVTEDSHGRLRFLNAAMAETATEGVSVIAPQGTLVVANAAVLCD